MAITITEDDLADLVGRELQDGSFRIDPDAHLRAMRIFHDPHYDSDVAHPVYGHIALNSGMGTDREDFFAMCGSTLRTGALFGRGVVTLHRPMRIGAEYTVTSRIVAAERKHGRRAGTFDLVTVHLTGTDVDDGVLTAELTETYVFLRGDGDAA